MIIIAHDYSLVKKQTKCAPALSQTESIYNDLLTKLKESTSNKTKTYCLFDAQVGKKFNNNLMIVGRAVNEWDNEFTFQQLDHLDARKILGEPHEIECPLSWVCDKNNRYPRTSAFWRVSNKISQILDNNFDVNTWTSKIAWSNLYKITPSNGGNPSNNLCDLQFEHCNKILEVEISHLKPKIILFYTGLNWFNGFIPSIDIKKTTEDFKMVEAFGHYTVSGNNSKVIIAKHPQGKKEDIFISEVINILKSV